jgi:cytochrome b561
MVLMPITGILAVLGGGHAWTVFGIELVAKGDKIPWMASLGGLHSPIAWMLTIMIAGHIGLALLHQVIGKDRVLQRMI